MVGLPLIFNYAETFLTLFMLFHEFNDQIENTLTGTDFSAKCNEQMNETNILYRNQNEWMIIRHVLLFR